MIFGKKNQPVRLKQDRLFEKQAGCRVDAPEDAARMEAAIKEPEGLGAEYKKPHRPLLGSETDKVLRGRYMHPFRLLLVDLALVMTVMTRASCAKNCCFIGSNSSFLIFHFSLTSLPPYVHSGYTRPSWSGRLAVCARSGRTSHPQRWYR